MMDLLLYVLTVVLWLAFAWVTACIYLTIRYNDDGKKYVVYKYHTEDGEFYTCVRKIGSVRFPTAYLIVSAMLTMSKFILASPCDENDERQVVIAPISNKDALLVGFEGPLKNALSKKYNI